ncbi:hypothetical protein Q8A73_018174 [Channa argus]|nr:hypothetical protein Q8A73_018174 [Channa argus]
MPLGQAITYLLLSLQWCSCPMHLGLSDLPACKLVAESFNSLPAFVHIPEPINLSPFPELICGCPVPAPASGLATIPSVSVPESPNALDVPEPVSTLADIKPVPAPALQLAVILPYAVPKLVNAPSCHAPGIVGALPAPESSCPLDGFSFRHQLPAQLLGPKPSPRHSALSTSCHQPLTVDSLSLAPSTHPIPHLGSRTHPTSTFKSSLLPRSTP